MAVDLGKPHVLIQNWNLEVAEAGWAYLTGKVFGHERFPNGHDVRTSAIVDYEILDGQEILESKNTIYLLGDACC
jgi:hypothetical protein